MSAQRLSNFPYSLVVFSCLSFRIAIARIAAAGGAFTFEDEVDPAKFVRVDHGGRDALGHQLGP